MEHLYQRTTCSDSFEPQHLDVHIDSGIQTFQHWHPFLDNRQPNLSRPVRVKNHVASTPVFSQFFENVGWLLEAVASRVGWMILDVREDEWACGADVEVFALTLSSCVGLSNEDCTGRPGTRITSLDRISMSNRWRWLQGPPR